MQIETKNYKLTSNNEQNIVNIDCPNFKASFTVAVKNGKPVIDFCIRGGNDDFAETVTVPVAAKRVMPKGERGVPFTPRKGCKKLSAVNDCILVDPKFIRVVYDHLDSKKLTIKEFTKKMPCGESTFYKYMKTRKFTTRAYKYIIDQVAELKTHPVDYVHLA